MKHLMLIESSVWLLALSSTAAAQCAGNTPTTNAITVLDVAPGIASSDPEEIVVANQMVYWSTTAGGNQLYRFDSSTQAAPVRVPINGTSGSNPANLVAYGEDLLLGARSSTGSTNQVHRVFANGQFQLLAGGTAVSELLVVGDLLYYSGQSSGEKELWRRDLITGATGFAFNSQVAGDPQELTAVGDKVFFSCKILGGSRRLHCYDPTTNLTEIFSGVLAPTELTAVGNRLFCSADGGSGIGTELFVSDGTQAGTGLVQNIHLGSGGGSSSNPQSLVSFADHCYFSATNGISGRELWRSNGSTATLVADLNGGGGNSSPEALVATESALYFVAAGTGAAGKQVYRITDGGTPQLQCVNAQSSAFGTNPKLAAIGDDVIVASGYGGLQVGREPWLHDAGGAHLLTDLNPSSSSANSYPSEYASNTEYVYFISDNGTNGREVYQVAIADLSLATWRRYGVGCVGTSGIPDLAGVGVPSLGNSSFAIAGADLPANRIALLGGGDGIVLLPGSCGLLIATVIVTAAVVADANGDFQTPLPIPASPALAGQIFTFQHFPYEPTLPAHFSASNGLAIYLN